MPQRKKAVKRYVNGKYVVPKSIKITQPDGRPTKGAATRRALFEHPEMCSSEIRDLLREKGVETTVSSIETIKAWMRNEGINLPVLHTNPNQAMNIAAREEILADPTAGYKVISRRLAQKGFSSSLNFVRWVRRAMRREGQTLPNLASKSPLPSPTLNKQQRILFKQVKPAVDKAIRFVCKKHGISGEDRQDFELEVLAALPRFVTRYNPSKGTKPETYITERINWFARDFIRETLQQDMGFDRAQTRVLIRLIRSRHRGETEEEMAKKEGISVSEVQKILRAFDEMSATKNLSDFPDII